MEDKIRYIITNAPNMEELFVEFYYNRVQWGQIDQETGSLILELYPNRYDAQGLWRFDFDEFLFALQEARRGLVGE